jgi:hypothetical protein
MARSLAPTLLPGSAQARVELRVDPGDGEIERDHDDAGEDVLDVRGACQALLLGLRPLDAVEHLGGRDGGDQIVARCEIREREYRADGWMASLGGDEDT